MSRLLPLTLPLLLAACDRTPVRVGAKGFAEQRVLAEVLGARLEQVGVRPTEIVECGDTYACQHALRAGRLDLMVDYTGTGLHFVGAPPGDTSLARLDALYATSGLRWRVPLGFDNTYAVVVRSERARTEGWTRIEDLAAVKSLRVACPRAYVRRPRDGLNALATRHGLSLAGAPLFEEDPGKRYATLRDGRADAVIGYATDAAIADQGLTVLDDGQRFFPPYEAVVVVRDESLHRHPRIAEALDPLKGRIDSRRMRALNAAVQVCSWSLCAGADPAEGLPPLLEPA